MKLKKTLALIMSAALSVATLSGCSQSTLNYTDELAKTSEWSGSTCEATGKVSVEAQGVTEDISFTSTGYSDGDKAYAEIKFDDPSGKIKLPEIKTYTDGSTSYINKSYYEEIYTLNGLAVPEGLKNINADYIGIDTGIDANALKAFTNGSKSFNELSKLVFGDSDIDLPYVQNGREYTLSLNSEDMINLGVKGIKAASNNLENINTKFNLGLKDEDMSAIKAAIADKAFDQGIGGMRDLIAGSTLTSKEVFSDDKYTSDINAVIKVKDRANVTVSINSQSSKSEGQTVTMPTNTVKFTQEEFSKLLAQSEQVQTSSFTTALKNVAA